MRVRSYLRTRSFGYALAIVVAAFTLAAGLLPSEALSSLQSRIDRTVAPAGVLTFSTPPSSAAPRSLAAPEVGSLAVMRTDFPGYNGSLAGDFFGTVDGWEVGSPALVPATGTLWLPQLNLFAGNASAPAPAAPAAEFNLSHGTFEGIDPAITNATALAFDPANGLLYAAQPHNDTVGGYNATTGAPSGPTYKVGSDPDALAYDPPTHFLFVANKGTNNVTVINTTTGKVAYSNVTVGTGPIALADDPTDEWIFVANSGSSYVSVINASSPTTPVATTVTVSGSPTDLAYDSSSRTVGVTFQANRNMTLLDAKSHGVITTLIAVGLGMTAIVPSSNGSLFIVANSSGAALAYVNASSGSVSPTAPVVASGPTQLALDSQFVWVWSNVSRIIESVDVSSGKVGTVSPSLGPTPSSIAFDSGSGALLVGESNPPYVEDMDPFTARSTLPPIQPSSGEVSVAADPKLRTIVVAYDSAVAEYNDTTGALVATNTTLTGGNGPVFVDASQGTVWVGRPASHEIVGLNATTLLGVATWNSITVDPLATQSIAFDPIDSYLFAFDLSTGKVNVFNASSHADVATGLSAGTNVTALAWDPLDGLVYVAGKGTIEAINGSTLAVTGATVPLPAGGQATGIAFDPSRGAIFVASSTSKTGPGALEEVPASSAPQANSSLTVVRLGDGPSSVVIVPPANSSVGGLSAILVAENTSGSISLVGTPPSIASFSFVPAATDVGSPTLAKVVPAGGVGTSSISYVGLPSGCPSADLSELSCTANVSGTYGVRSLLTDALGEVATANATLTVNGSINVHATFGSLATPESDVGVKFHVTASTTGGTPPIQFAWSFGDGGIGSGGTTTHTYRTAGTYVASVTATDAVGGHAIASQVVDVVPLPLASISVSPLNRTDVEIPLDLGANIVGGTLPGSGTWSFGDGQTSTSADVSHAWAQAGPSYNVSFNYTDASGEISDTFTSIRVNPALQGTFSAEPISSSGSFGSSAAFGFAANLTGGTTPINVTWSFGDSSGATGTSVTHVYGSPGSYDVQAVATDAAGAVLRSTIVVLASAPSKGASPWWGGSFVPTLILGLVVGGAGAAVVLFILEQSRRPPRHRPPSAYVPPDPRVVLRRD
jgi:YVTN family beta-propeller protein